MRRMQLHMAMPGCSAADMGCGQCERYTTCGWSACLSDASWNVQSRRQGFQPEAVASLRSQSELIDRQYVEELTIPGPEECPAALHDAGALQVLCKPPSL